jgi:hypothetical protein
MTIPSPIGEAEIDNGVTIGPLSVRSIGSSKFEGSSS